MIKKYQLKRDKGKWSWKRDDPREEGRVGIRWGNGLGKRYASIWWDRIRVGIERGMGSENQAEEI